MELFQVCGVGLQILEYFLCYLKLYGKNYKTTVYKKRYNVISINTLECHYI